MAAHSLILDTKENFLWEKQSREVIPPPDKTLTKSGVAADAKAVGDSFTANFTASDGLQFKFGKDGDGNYGYYGADGSLIPFSNLQCMTQMFDAVMSKTNGTYSYTVSKSVFKGKQSVLVFLWFPFSAQNQTQNVGPEIHINSITGASYKLLISDYHTTVVPLVLYNITGDTTITYDYNQNMVHATIHCLIFG